MKSIHIEERIKAIKKLKYELMVEIVLDDDTSYFLECETEGELNRTYTQLKKHLERYKQRTSATKVDL